MIVKQKIRLLVCIVFTTCLSINLSAKPEITSVVPTNGVCLSDCKITVNATTSGNGVKYGLINYPTIGQTRTQDGNVFEGLEPGTYTVGVWDHTSVGGPTTAVVTVTSSYQEMYLNSPTTGNNTGDYCNPNGTLRITFTGGRAPFRFKIKGPVTQERTNIHSRDQTFTGLPSGDYEIEVQDACDQWRQNIPGKPIKVTSYSVPWADANFTSLTAVRGSNSIVQSNNTCNTVTIRYYSYDLQIATSVPSNITASSYPNIEFRIQSPAGTGTWTNWITGGPSWYYFYNVPYTKGTKYRVQARHTCKPTNTVEVDYDFPPEPSFTYYASNSITYPEFCSPEYNPQIQVYPSNNTNEIHGYACGPYTFTLKQGTTIIHSATTTGSTSSYAFTKSHGVQAGVQYSAEIWKGASLIQTLSPITVTTYTPATPTTYYHHGHVPNYYADGKNYAKCDFATTTIYARRNINPTTTTKRSITYTILEPASYAGRTKTLTANGDLWDDLPNGYEYKIKEEYEGCPTPKEQTVDTRTYISKFTADELRFENDGSVCGTYRLVGKGRYHYKNITTNIESEYTGANNSYSNYKMMIIDGPLKSDGTKTVGLSTTHYSNYEVGIPSVPGGTYKVIFYAHNTPVAYDPVLGINKPTCHFAERTITIPEYVLPKLNVPMSGGISCSDGNAIMTINAVGDRTPFQYRYKVKDAPDNTYTPADFQTSNVFTELSPGKYTVQIKDMCGSIGTQDLQIFKGGDQFVEIIGGVEVEEGKSIVCKGQPVTLQVKSIGPVSYHQWSKGPTPTGPWTELTDQGQHPTYSIGNAVPGDVGYYKVTIYNGACTLSSSVHIVEVRDPAPTPTIIAPSKVCPGKDFVLKAVTTVTEAHTFQWYREGVAIAGAIADTYTTNVTGNYTVIVIPAANCPSNQQNPAHNVQSDADYCIKAKDDEFTMNACETDKIIDVQVNDELNSCAVDLVIKVGPLNGTATVVTDGGKKKIKYTPNNTFAGVDELTYEVACGTDKAAAKLKIFVDTKLMVKATQDAAEPNTQGKFRVSFTCPTVKFGSKLRVTYVIKPAGTTAEPNVDYTPLTGTVEIFAGATGADIIVSPIEPNFKVEGDRKLEIEITNVDIL